MAKIGLISCVSSKLDRPAPAGELYTSQLFTKSKFYAENRLDRFYILSAKYGLLDPSEVIEPYDETLKEMPKPRRIEWAEKVFQRLIRETSPDDQIVFLAGNSYRENLEIKLADHGYATATPLSRMGIGEQLGWYTDFAAHLDYVSDLDRFYSLMRRLSDGLGGTPKLREISRMQLPQRGVYFFFEPNEFRKSQPFEHRVVRVGTHGLKEGSAATLWSRLNAHKGSRDSGGHHRSSVFRLHVGKSILETEKINLETWGVGSSAPKEIRLREADIEIAVSQRIAEMGVLWVTIDDSAGPNSDRAFIEKNSIALLSTLSHKIDTASEDWLGRVNPNRSVAGSSLWNVRHVDQEYDPRYLLALADYVDATIGRLRSDGVSIVSVRR